MDSITRRQELYALRGWDAPERGVAARHCVSCEVDGPRHFSSLGRYRNRTVACTARANGQQMQMSLEMIGRALLLTYTIDSNR